MAKQRPAWVKDAKTFIGFAFLSAVLTYPCGIAIGITELMCGGSGCVSWVWFAVFAAPPMLVSAIGWEIVVHPAAWLSPLIYGLIWWGIWRAVKLFRTSPTE